MSVIRFDRVSLTFPGADRPAVDSCSGNVRSGELVAILGPSGCGKTTLLKMVNRLYEPTSGTVYLDETDIRQLPPAQLRRRIGYVLQKAGLFPHMNVAENIAVVPRLLGWSRSRIRARVDELLLLVELAPGDYRDRYPSQLSGGEQQRVGIARALAGEPQAILMDEPFSALDAITRAGLQAEILRLQQQLHKTILFVSHDVEEALRLGDRLLILRAGRVVQFDTPYAILMQPADEFVANLMGADDRVRLLSLLRVAAATTPIDSELPNSNYPAIALDATLRQALSTLLKTGGDTLLVTQGAKPVGIVTLDRLRELAYSGKTALGQETRQSDRAPR